MYPLQMVNSFAWWPFHLQTITRRSSFLKKKLAFIIDGCNVTFGTPGRCQMKLVSREHETCINESYENYSLQVTQLKFPVKIVYYSVCCAKTNSFACCFDAYISCANRLACKFHHLHNLHVCSAIKI